MPVHERPDGARIAFEVAGDPRRPAIVLLEGMGGDLRGWRRNVPHLAAELFVVAFDHRGNGRSTGPEARTTMDTYVEDCLGLLDELRIERAHLYGLSFGGMVALELALTHPARVRSAVLAATHPGSKHRVSSAARAPKGRPWLLLYSPSFAADHPDHVEDDRRLGSARAQPEGRRRQWEAVQGWDAYDRLPDVAVPVLVLHGTEDRVVHAENARVLAERIPDAELVLLEGAGHAVHSERADRSDEVVLDFVRRHRG